MNGLTRWLVRLAATVAVACAAGGAWAETCELKLKRTDDSSDTGLSRNVRNMLGWVSSQTFWTQMNSERPDVDQEFREVVKKQPEKYEYSKPFRCVARLGEKRYGLVFDSTAFDKKGFNRIYLDRNGNGDLTDDEVVKAKSSGTQPWGSGLYGEFPTITMRIRAGEVEFDYSFSVSVQMYGSDKDRYVNAALQSKVYREGEITLDGRKRSVFLLDYNSNGRFDDLYTVNREIRTSDGRVWPTDGDILLLDPKQSSGEINWYDPTVNSSRVYVTRTVNIDGKFHDLKTSPSGDKLTLEPSKAAVGHVVNPNASFRAMVYGDSGILAISGTKGSPIPLPEGEWRLLSYTIDLTSTSQPATKPAEKPARKGGLLSRLVGSVVGTAEESITGPKLTMVSASGTKDYKPVKVKKGETADLPFGPPYKPTVKVEDWFRRKGSAELSMDVVGSAGEVCTNLMVKGERPESPTFAIVAPDGEIVERGKFEYG